MNREIILLISVVITFFVFLYLIPLGYWFMARISGIKITILQLLMMRLKGIAVKKILNAMILAKKGDISVPLTTLLNHYKNGGDNTNVILGLISAKTVGIDLSIEEAMKKDLQGINLFEQIKEKAEKRK